MPIRDRNWATCRGYLWVLWQGGETEAIDRVRSRYDDDAGFGRNKAKQISNEGDMAPNKDKEGIDIYRLALKNAILSFVRLRIEYRIFSVQ
jgi:hypothetical protein